jgi:hypothetical protein
MGKKTGSSVGLSLCHRMGGNQVNKNKNKKKVFNPFPVSATFLLLFIHFIIIYYFAKKKAQNNAILACLDPDFRVRIRIFDYIYKQHNNATNYRT